MVGPRDDVHHPPIVGAGQDDCPVAEPDLIPLDDQMGALGYDTSNWGDPSTEGAGKAPVATTTVLDATRNSPPETTKSDGVAVSHRIHRSGLDTADGYGPEDVDGGPGDGDDQTGIVGLGVGVHEPGPETRRPRFGKACELGNRDPPMAEPGRSKPPSTS